MCHPGTITHIVGGSAQQVVEAGGLRGRDGVPDEHDTAAGQGTTEALGREGTEGTARRGPKRRRSKRP